MTVQIDIKPEVEARLVARAESSGQSLEAFIQRLLESEAAQANGAHPLTGPEKAAAFEAWANSFPSNMPVLSLEDVSREKIYQRD
jgi:hypothetical protein